MSNLWSYSHTPQHKLWNSCAKSILKHKYANIYFYFTNSANFINICIHTNINETESIDRYPHTIAKSKYNELITQNLRKGKNIFPLASFPAFCRIQIQLLPFAILRLVSANMSFHKKDTKSSCLAMSHQFWSLHTIGLVSSFALVEISNSKFGLRDFYPPLWACLAIANFAKSRNSSS